MPSLTARALDPDNVTVGATLLTVTVWVSVLLVALSESLTCTDTVLEAGPSGNVQTKLPPEPSWSSNRPGCRWRRSSTATTLNVSWPGSVT